MSSDVEVDFARALRAAAGSAEPPAPVDLYAGAVDRGLRIRRRTKLRQALAGAAVLGVVAAVGIPLLGGGGSGTATVGTAPAPTARAAVTAGPTGTGATAGPPPGTAWVSAYMVQSLKSLLPAGASTAEGSIYGGKPLQAFIPSLDMDGQWAAVLEMDVTTPAGKSALHLELRDSPQSFVQCPSQPVVSCSSPSHSGGTLIVEKGVKPGPVGGKGSFSWNLYWNAPKGRSMIFREETDGSQQALTMQQAIALVTASVWDRVWKSLPADCPLGATDDPHASAALVATGGGSVCATSRDYGLYVVSAAPTPSMSSR